MKTTNTITVYRNSEEDRFIKGWLCAKDIPHTWSGAVEYHTDLLGNEYHLIAITYDIVCDNHYFNRVVSEL